MKYLAAFFLTVLCSPAFAQDSEYDRGFNAGYEAGFSAGFTESMQAHDFDPAKSNQFPDLKRPEIVPDARSADDGRFQGFGNGVLDNPRGPPLIIE